MDKYKKISLIQIEKFVYERYNISKQINKQEFQDIKINMILETERLYLREMDQTDFEALCKILQDEDTMYAYEGAFSDDEVHEWLDRQIARYQKWGFGLWAAVLKKR